MKTLKSAISRVALAGIVASMATFGMAQAANTVVATFGTAPASGNSFTVNLATTGPSVDVAGFAFKLIYNPAQVSIQGVSDNTGQANAGVQYTLGPVTQADGATTAARILTATTLHDLKGASNLAEVKLVKKAGYAAPLYFQVTDRASEPIIDGLQSGALENIPHSFNATAVNK